MPTLTPRLPLVQVHLHARIMLKDVLLLQTCVWTCNNIPPSLKNLEGLSSWWEKEALKSYQTSRDLWLPHPLTQCVQPSSLLKNQLWFLQDLKPLLSYPSVERLIPVWQGEKLYHYKLQSCQWKPLEKGPRMDQRPCSSNIEMSLEHCTNKGHHCVTKCSPRCGECGLQLIF